MKKIFTLLVVALFGFGQLWAENARIEGEDFEGNREWDGPHAHFTISGEGASSTTVGGDGRKLQLTENNVYTISWTVDPGYIIHVTKIETKIGAPTLGFDLYFNDIKCGGVGMWSTKDGVYLDGLSLGNDDVITVKMTRTGNLYYIDITYTVTPITYSVAFDGNGSTAGSMDEQSFTYDEAQDLDVSAFERIYTVSFDAKMTEVVALTAEYTFAGWALSADGEKAYDPAQHVSNLTTEDGGTVRLYAVWKETAVILPAVEKEGYRFEGWFMNEEKIGEAGDAFVPTANVTLSALWTDINSELPTALDTVGAGNKAAKVLRDGVIYIRCEGKEFTLDGRVVK